MPQHPSRLPRIAAIHDLSGVGKCSLTIALPVLSAMGCEVCAMPTAILSTHTGNIPGFTYRDLTDDLPGIAAHWASLDLTFDAIYTGFAASAAQLTAISGAVDLLRGDRTIVLVDPVMGDHGSLYKTYTPEMVDATRELCRKATIITPNVTEAALLLDRPYDDIVKSEASIREVMTALRALGPACVVMTGIKLGGMLGTAVLDNTHDDPVTMLNPAAPGVWYGTGDLFASVFLGAMLSGAPTVYDAAMLAIEIVTSSINRTRDAGVDQRFGVLFEAELGRLYAYAQSHAHTH